MSRMRRAIAAALRPARSAWKRIARLVTHARTHPVRTLLCPASRPRPVCASGPAAGGPAWLTRWIAHHRPHLPPPAAAHASQYRRAPPHLRT